MLRADTRAESARLQLDLRSGEIRAIVWATGFRPDYGWLNVPVADAKGQLRHEGGVVDSPGLYALRLPVLCALPVPVRAGGELPGSAGRAWSG